MRHLALVIIATALLAGCAAFPEPTSDRSTADGRRLLEDAARAHGWGAYQRLKDISVSYDGHWYSTVKRLQPVLVDSQFRGTSEERIIIAERRIGQTHRGPGGTKHVARSSDDIEVWFNDRRELDGEKRAAAALVADGYRLFLLGPIYLLEREALVEHAGMETLDGVEYERLFARLRPGLGYAREDRVMLWIDKQTGLTHRLWISADGMPTTQGVIAEIDLRDYREIAGVHWPTRFFERLKRPFPLDVHRWHVVGLDVDRGYSAADIAGQSFRGAAARPASPLPARRDSRH